MEYQTGAFFAGIVFAVVVFFFVKKIREKSAPAESGGSDEPSPPTKTQK